MKAGNEQRSSQRKTRIFVYESVCAGALGADVPPSLRAEGWAMLSAVAEDLQGVAHVEVATLLDATFSASAGDQCRHTSRGAEFDHFRDLASRSDGTLVIAPEFDDVLRSRSQMVLDAGGLLLGSLPAAIALTGDKWATSRLLASRRIPHPLTELLDVTALPRFEPPWVLKPRHGAGSQATFLVRDGAEISHASEAASREWPAGEFIVQRYVPGLAASVAVLVGPNQIVPLVAGRQHLSDDGRFHYEGGSLPLPAPLATRAARLAQRAVAGIASLRGYVGVDLVLGESDDGGGDYVIEINPRLTTSYIGLRRLCRQNLAELMLRIVVGETIERPVWRAGEVEFRADDCERIWGLTPPARQGN